MDHHTIGEFRDWFERYVAGFYGDDEYVNANIKLKEEHSRRTCQEILYLTGQLQLDDNQRRLAEAIALFHDIGRFEQFARYRTYNDPRSINHSLLGVDVLRKTKAIEGLEQTEREVIEKAIEYHGLMELPADLDGECLLFSRLIRDADKVDIFYVVTDYYTRYRENPNGFKLEIELPDEPGYSAEVVEAILSRQRIDYAALRTWNDMKLCQLGWVYDVNFIPTMKRIKQRKFLERIIDFLPQTGDIDRVKEKIFEYVDSVIEHGCK